MDQARRLALADERVAQVAAARKLAFREVQATGLLNRGADYRDVACRVNRCVEVTLDSPQGSRSPLTVVVNLSLQRIERVVG
jgi:hypothetical protein